MPSPSRATVDPLLLAAGVAMSEALSDQAEAFLVALDELCRTHAIQLVFNSDGVVELWPLQDEMEALAFEAVADQLGDAADEDDSLE